MGNIRRGSGCNTLQKIPTIIQTNLCLEEKTYHKKVKGDFNSWFNMCSSMWYKILMNGYDLLLIKIFMRTSAVKCRRGGAEHQFIATGWVDGADPVVATAGG